MIQFTVTVEIDDYDMLLESIFPLISQNKITARAALYAIKSRFADMTEKEKETAIANFLSDNNLKLTSSANRLLTQNSIPMTVTSLKSTIN